MDFSLSPSEQAFKEEVRTWLEEHLVGEFAELRGRGGTGQEDIPPAQLIEWERELARGGWLALGYPAEFGGRDCSVFEQVIFHMAYVESRAPGRLPNMGLTLAGPTIVAYGTEAQQQRFIPRILRAEEMWCQGYSEPNAGSDLANVATRAVLDGDQWVINGQKVWTSLAQYSDWCFAVCRTDPKSTRHNGLSYLLVPMEQPGIEIRPIVQITGGAEFNEVFFTDARTSSSLVVGAVGKGWEVAMGTLSFERGASTLGQQLAFRRELDALVAYAQHTGAAADPVIRQELAQAYATLEIMRYNNLRMLTVIGSGGVPGPEMSIGKLYWANWHRSLGELMVKVMGAAAMVASPDAMVSHEKGAMPYPLSPMQRTFIYSRAHTIYAGSNEIQRNVIGERVLGLPREPR
ncbi:MAG TPA: acyl-CoA dehydrogenase family protein [Acidimicrobiales bacterium]|jgi:alkylation response protein AidB-like acyl-CoA dehydrogenase|nr:acyl-CoA dehydrogenase family protein [Acidimicrobiales bacterium]